MQDKLHKMLQITNVWCNYIMQTFLKVLLTTQIWQNDIYTLNNSCKTFKLRVQIWQNVSCIEAIIAFVVSLRAFRGVIVRQNRCFFAFEISSSAISASVASIDVSTYSNN